MILASSMSHELFVPANEWGIEFLPVWLNEKHTKSWVTGGLMYSNFSQVLSLDISWLNPFLAWCYINVG